MIVISTLSTPAPAGISIVRRPDFSHTNDFYICNQSPLEPSRFIPLPGGAVRLQGWLLECMNRQRDGLSGKWGEISGWLQKGGNA